MKKWIIALLVLGASVPASAQIPNHKATVAAARVLYADLSGPQRAYCIVNKVAWDLSAEGAGAFFKSGGSNYLQRSLDIAIYKPGGETFDILGDSEGNANPQWGRTSPSGFGDVAKWRAAINPVGMAACPTSDVPPDPPDTPDPPPSDALAARVAALEVTVARQGTLIQAHDALIQQLQAQIKLLAAQPPVCTPGQQSTSRSGWPAHGHTVWTCIPTAAQP